MRDAVICCPVRTPVGRFGGVLRGVSAASLAATVITAVLERSGLPVTAVDDVILGQAYPNGEEPSIGRVAALDAGLPVEVPGLQVDRRCGSGLQAVLDAAMRVQTGVADVVLAGGAESMSSVEHYALGLRWGARSDVTLMDRLARGRITAGGRNHPVEGGMLETAENLRRAFDIPRHEQDQLALHSHQRAVAAQQALDRAGLTLDQMDLIELNEAFAAQALAVMRAWDFSDVDHDRTNVNGSGISLGHPVGATGTRILTTLLHELDRREARYGLETMCIGGGQGLAVVFERIRS